MSVDVLIPVYKPGQEFAKLLCLLQKQTVKLHKIIIMNTEELYWERFLFGHPELKKLSRLELHHVSQKEFDHGGTRHTGMQYSQADICVCMTQDALPCDEHMLEALIAPLQNAEVAVSYARQLPKPGASLLEKFGRGFNYPPESRLKTAADIDTMGIKAFFCSDVCAAYNKRIYQELGGFIRHTIFNEDMLYAFKALQAGYGVYYAAEARVLHSHDYGFIRQLRRNFDLGVSQADHPEVFAGISSEKEGKRMVRTACGYFCRQGKPLEIVHLVVQSGAKYIGYFLGKRYKKLPRAWVKKISDNPSYWHKHRIKMEQEQIDATKGYGKSEAENQMRQR